MLLCSNAIAQSQSCFDKVILEPGFISFTTTNSSNLEGWYQKVFDLSTVKEFSSADGVVSGLLMKKGEFVVEIFKRNDALHARDHIEDFRSEKLTGCKKVGIYTNANLTQLKQCLLTQEVSAGRIFNDENLDIDLLSVVDPEGNVLELISRASQ